jgi:hypothetical protein
MVGQKLMRAAFHPDNGNLTDMDNPQSERQAVIELFSDAMGHGSAKKKIAVTCEYEGTGFVATLR